MRQCRGSGVGFDARCGACPLALTAVNAIDAPISNIARTYDDVFPNAAVGFVPNSVFQHAKSARAIGMSSSRLPVAFVLCILLAAVVIAWLCIATCMPAVA